MKKPTPKKKKAAPKLTQKAISDRIRAGLDLIWSDGYQKGMRVGAKLDPPPTGPPDW